MIITLSPSKGQDFASPWAIDNYTTPKALQDSQVLIDKLRLLNLNDLRNLMKISENIANLNIQRYQSFKIPFTKENAKPALLAFKGDVYSRIGVENYRAEDLDYAQQHLRILSGLYGCLRPLDLIQPYRLEMKTRLENPRGINLYQFWGERITEQLNLELAKQQQSTLINLASHEYFKSVKTKLLQGRLLTINFKEIKKGKARVIAIFAKRARGLMTDYILQNRLETPEGIKDFNQDGYQYSSEYSDEKQWTFTRIQK